MRFFVALNFSFFESLFSLSLLIIISASGLAQVCQSPFQDALYQTLLSHELFAFLFGSSSSKYMLDISTYKYTFNI